MKGGIEMFQRLLQLIKDALSKVKTVSADGRVSVQELYPLANKMQIALDLWSDMYADESPWLDDVKGIFSFGIPASICEELARYVLTEMDSHIVVAGVGESDKAHDESHDEEPTNRAEWLDKIYHERLLKNMNDTLEKAMAHGGMVIKPYISNNSIHYDICYQGEFVPIAFDDDGNITDIAFHDSFVEGNIRYSKVERHKFDISSRTITITNKAYKTKNNSNADTTELGNEIPLVAVDKWALIEPEIEVTNIDKPLYGYYKVPIANNIDINCPLGVSVFHKASKVIERADRQFSRLDWEYDAGQMAIDVDPMAIKTDSGYYGTSSMDDLRSRVYRKLDLGTDDTYKEFAPTLRDASYINGLNLYLMRIEDICGVARGTISNVDGTARTATEILILKQKTYVTTASNQEALQRCLEDVIYATNVLADYYKDELNALDGEYVMNTEWSDSAIVDTYTELEQRLNLVNAGIMSKAEVRSWYMGEDIDTANTHVNAIASENSANLLNDIFANANQSTLEM